MNAEGKFVIHTVVVSDYDEFGQHIPDSYKIRLTLTTQEGVNISFVSVEKGSYNAVKNTEELIEKAVRALLPGGAQ